MECSLLTRNNTSGILNHSTRLRLLCFTSEQNDSAKKKKEASLKFLSQSNHDYVPQASHEVYVVELLKLTQHPCSDELLSGLRKTMLSYCSSPAVAEVQCIAS